MSTTFCTWLVVLVETNSNLVCLGEEVDLMELDGIKSNLTWQEIEVDNLMELDEAADWIKRLDDLVTKHLICTKHNLKSLRNEAPNFFQKITH